MKKYSKFLSIVIMVAMIFTLAACGSENEKELPQQESSQQENSEKGEKTDSSKKKVAVFVRDITNAFYDEIQTGANAAAEEYGFECKVYSPITPNSNEEQLELIDDVLLEHPDVVMIAPCDSQGITPGIEKLNEAGIPVVTYAGRATGEGIDIVTFVGVDNVEIGYMEAESIAEKIGGKGKVVLLEGTPSGQTSIDRMTGAKQAFEKYPDIEIIDSQIANQVRTEGMTVMQNMLQKHQQIDGVFSVNSEMALGAAEAIAQAGKTGDIIIGSVDFTPEVIQAIKDGKLSLTVDQRGYMQGYLGVEVCSKVLKGEDIEDWVKVENIRVVDSSNVDNLED